jgi:hypothetical protein
MRMVKGKAHRKCALDAALLCLQHQWAALFWRKSWCLQLGLLQSIGRSATSRFYILSQGHFSALHSGSIVQGADLEGGTPATRVVGAPKGASPLRTLQGLGNAFQPSLWGLPKHLGNAHSSLAGFCLRMACIRRPPAMPFTRAYRSALRTPSAPPICSSTLHPYLACRLIYTKGSCQTECCPPLCQIHNQYQDHVCPLEA